MCLPVAQVKRSQGKATVVSLVCSVCVPTLSNIRRKTLLAFCVRYEGGLFWGPRVVHVFVCVTWCFVLVYVCVYVYTESSCNKDWEGGIKRMERVDRIRLLSNVEMESTNWFYLHFLVYLFPLFIVLYSEFFFSNLFSFSFFYSSEPNLFYSRFFFF